MKVFFLTIFVLFYTVKKTKAEKSVQKSPCGTFIPYDPISQPNLPETHGVLAGKFSDTTQIYVGTGKTWCGSNLPARLSIVAESGPGAYVYCAGSEIYNYSSSAYLENNSGLQWIDTDENSFYNVSGALKVKIFFCNNLYWKSKCPVV
ncbi:hypothetical protein PVAND_017332 [Polypedilum vanderplanki]|uniref:Uncharacterized protein n=1 Tax=Polypedilum vanderplanki TaxID=319348 RepID=A0A9J6BHZ5_POLVA|nr:hypothetical protein PVAND_017332 [Polypedilum vanderplanki]